MAIAAESKTNGEINFIFCNDEFLIGINRKYLNHDNYTDIITFDYSEGNVVSGDIFISIDRIKENAKNYGVSFENELYRVMIHGILHLCGYKDKRRTEKEKMTAGEDKYLSELEMLLKHK